MDRVVASFFGSGLLLRRIRGSDAGSGTVGSLVALLLSLWIGSVFSWPGQLAGAVILTATALGSTRRLANEEGDAGWIVIDEVAGTFVSTIGLLGWPAVGALVVFRLADISKTSFPGVGQAERLPGALGITADDTIAGLYGLLFGHLLRIAAS